MEISKYNKAMQFLLKPKYLTKDFIIQAASDAPPETSEGFANGGKVDPKTKMILDMLKRGADVDTISAITGATVEEINKIIQAPKKMSWTSDAQLDTNDSVTIETKPGFFPDMSGSTPPMDKVMPSFDGLEDPRMRQVELASGGVVQREGFAEGTNSELIKQSAAGVTGAAAIGTKTGRNILGKAFKGLAALDTPLAQIAYAATLHNPKEDSTFNITLPAAFTHLSAKELGLYAKSKGVKEAAKMIARAMPLQTFTKLAPIFSKAAGLGAPFIETAFKLYKARQELKAAREEYGTEDQVPTLVGMAPKEYVEKLQQDTNQYAVESGALSGEASTQEDYDAQKGGMQQINDILNNYENGGRVGYAYGSKLKLLNLLKKGKTITEPKVKGLKTTSLEGDKADYGTYKFTGQESMDDLYELERQGKLTREDMNVYDPRYMEYLDAQIINKEQLYTRKEWEKTPETIKNRTRGRIDPDWEEANFGEEFDWDQARSIEIDQTQKLKNFDTSGRTKQASGGRIGLNIDDIMNNYATGGRVGFEKGSKPPKDNPILPVNPMIDEVFDPSKRGFLKGAGAIGLGTAAIGTGVLKFGKKAKKLIKDIDINMKVDSDADWSDYTESYHASYNTFFNLKANTASGKKVLDKLTKEKKLIKEKDGTYSADTMGDINSPTIDALEEIKNKSSYDLSFNDKKFKNTGEASDYLRGSTKEPSPMKDDWHGNEWLTEDMEAAVDILAPKPIDRTIKEGLEQRIKMIERNKKAVGGRIGFEKGGKPPKDNPILPVNPMMDEGPQDPGKRTFLKGMGALGLGLAALGTGALKLAKTLKTKTALNVLANPAVGQPTWFAPLIDKILLKGIRLEKDGKKLNSYVLKEGDKTLTLDISSIPDKTIGYNPPGSVKNPININVQGGGAYDDPFDIQYYQRIDTGPGGDGKLKSSLNVVESRPHRFGPDADEIELSEELFQGTDLLELPKGGSGILSDMEGLEKIATGKIKDTKLANTRGKIRDELNQPNQGRGRYNPGEEDRLTRSIGPDGGDYYEELPGEGYFSVKKND
jgi:hypothetical protein